MIVLWRKLYIKIILWLGAEILLTLIGLDDLADYGEFLYGQKEVASLTIAYPTLTVNFVASHYQTQGSESLGYLHDPMNRGLGMAITLYPTIAMLFYDAYRVFKWMISAQIR